MQQGVSVKNHTTIIEKKPIASPYGQPAMMAKILHAGEIFNDSLCGFAAWRIY
ncbi:MAG: hypothetical protein PUB32_02460 [Clostridiales bacterium]|nr:hypothetical protein [Clostridiales bacterium]